MALLGRASYPQRRAFGEHVTSVKWRNMVNELLLKASVYNMFL